MAPSTPIKNSKMKKYLAIYVIIVLFIAIFISGFFIGGWQIGKLKPSEALELATKKQNIAAPKNFDQFWNVWNIIHTNYVSTQLEDQNLIYSSIAGLVNGLKDPYSNYLDPIDTKSFNEEMSGTFEGIGAEIGIKNDSIVIIAPLTKSPAEKAGLLANDVIMAIDDSDTGNMTLTEAVKKIRGPKGTEVTLMILREPDKNPQKISVTRDTITIHTISWEMKKNNRDEKIAYLQITHFNDETTSEFLKVINEIIIAGPKGIIVDLRNNPGGYLQTAIEITSEFLTNDQIIVIEEMRNGKKEQYSADGKSRLRSMKTVILINEGSASASEIMAGALQDHKRATLIGTTTFGKGLVQDYQQFPDGSSLKLTIAKWLTPNGRSINEAGIQPDIKIELSENDYKENKDPQLDEALNQF